MVVELSYFTKVAKRIAILAISVVMAIVESGIIIKHIYLK